MSEPNAAQFVVARHGETLWNRRGLQQGQADSPLSEPGIRQAEAIAEALADRAFDALYSSDLGRAVQTAGINAFTIAGDKWRLDLWGDVRHLRGMGTMDDW